MEIWTTLSAVVAGSCICLIGVALARLPRSRVAPVVYAFVASGVLWAVGDLLADTASSLASKQLGIALLYTGSIAIPALWWMLAVLWSREVGAGLPLRDPAWTRVPLTFAAIMWGVMITNPLHGGFLTPVVGGRNLYHTLWYVMAIPNYLLIVAALAVEVAVAVRVATPEVRRQAAFLVSASLVTLIGNWLYVLQWTPLNLTSLVLSASGALLMVGMAREGLFGVFPAALPDIAADHPDGLVLFGPTGSLRYANSRAHELLAPAALELGSNLDVLLDGEHLRPESSEWSELGGSAERWEKLVGRDGFTVRSTTDPARWLHLSATRVHGRRGGLKGYCLQVSDLTHVRQAELRARQTRRLDSVASLARSVSRELQGIFAVIHGNAELLAGVSEAPETSRAHERRLGRILEATRIGSELSQHLRLFTGTLDTTRVLLELSEVVEESCELVDSDLPNGVELSFLRSDEVLPVYADAVQVRHGLFNLLLNAIDSMQETSGRIEVRTGVARMDPATRELVFGGDQPADEFAMVSIRDEGGGMESGTEERAFEPFFSTRSKERGTGLSTVLGIARAHGAPFALDNEFGRGCTCTWYFPLERNAGSA